MPLKRAGVELVAEGQASFDRALDNANKSVRSFGDTADKAGAGVSKFGAIATGALVAVGAIAAKAAIDAGKALVGFAADSVSAASTYESSLNRFASVAGGALDDAGMSLDQFSDLALEMGAKTQFSAGEAADAMVELAKGGLTPATIAAGGLEGALALAAAGELDLAQASEITAKQLGIWADTGVDAVQVADLMAQAANASTVNVDDLAVGLANAGGSAKVAGVPFDELTQTMALLAPGFSSASDAGTSLKTFISRLVPATKPATEAMIDLGLATKDGASKFYDAQGAFIGMEAAAQLLQDATKDLSEEQKISALTAIFGADAIRASAIIAEKGAIGFREMGESMAAAGTAAEQAAKRNQGFGFAMESLRGSVETFQIVVGKAALPILTKFINQALIPGVNAATEFAQRIADAEDPLAELIAGVDGVLPGFATFLDIASTTASVVGDNAVPAVQALAAATLVYGLTSLPTMITSLTVATTGLYAHAAAATATLGPYALVAAAIFGVTKAWDNFNETYAQATDKLLESREWWTESTVALDAYHQSSERVQQAVSTTALALEAMRAKQEEEIESLQKRQAAGLVSEAQWGREMAIINDRAIMIEEYTGYLEEELQAQRMLDYAVEHSTTTTLPPWIKAVEDASGAQRQLKQDTALSTEEMEKLAASVATAAETAMASFGDLVDTEVGFMSGREQRYDAHEKRLEELIIERGRAKTDAERAAVDDRIDAEKEGYAESEREANIAYARELLAQRAHLGQMLIDYVEALGQRYGVAQERVGELTGLIAREYGVQEDISDTVFRNMAGDFEAWATDASISAGEVVGDLTEAEQQARDTQAATEDLTGEYIVDIVDNFGDVTGRLSEFNSEISKVPSKVVSRLETNFDSELYVLRDVHETLRNIPTQKTVTVTANVHPQVRRESPSPLEEALTNIQHLIETMPKLNLKASGVDQVSQLARALKDLADAASSFASLNEFVAPSAASIEAFAQTTQLIVREIQAVAKEFKKEGLEHAANFAESAGKIVDLLGQGAEGFAKLHEFEAPPRDRLQAFAVALRDAVADFWHEAQLVLYALKDDHAPKFAELAERVVGLIGSAVDAFEKLREYENVARDRLEAVATDIGIATDLMVQISQNADTEGIEAANAFATSVQAVFTLFKTGVEALDALRDYQAVPKERMETVAHDFADATSWMALIARNADMEGIETAAHFAVSSKSIFDLFKTGVEALDAIREYQSVPRERMEAVAADFYDATWWMGEIAKNADLEGIETASKFATASGHIFGAFKTGIEAMDAIRDYQAVPRDRFALFQADMLIAIDTMSDMVGQAGGMLKDAQAWESQLKSVAGAIQGGMNAIAALDGLNVNVSARVSASAGGGGGGNRTVAPPATGSQITNRALAQTTSTSITVPMSFYGDAPSTGTIAAGVRAGLGAAGQLADIDMRMA